MKINLLATLIFSLLCTAAVGAQGSISGRLLKANGKPLPYTEIELVPVGSKRPVSNPNLVAISAINGKFSFSSVPTGSYTLSINFGEKPTDLSPYETFFYPATANRREAEIFELESGASFENLLFQLPPALAQRTVTGKVFDEQGKAVTGAMLALRDLKADQGVFFGASKTNRTGDFSFNAFIGRRYQVAAVVMERFGFSIYDPLEIVGAAESEEFTLGAAPVVLRLTIKKRPDYDYIRDRYISQVLPGNNFFSTF